MEKYIEDWLTVIENMNNENTYKLAWGKSIVELCFLMEDVEDEKMYDFSFEAITMNMFKYYWNQTYFFRLEQSPNPSKRAKMLQLTENAIKYYENKIGKTVPVWFDVAIKEIKKDKEYYIKLKKEFCSAARSDVCYRFLKANKKEYNLYSLNNEKTKISIHGKNILLIKEYAFVLSQLLNYKWAQLLEKFNSAPRINNKVEGSSKNEIRRNNLSKFKEELLKINNGKAIDFYTGQELLEEDISVDHVIPWSFMYSDDIWNLVITSKSNNSSKSNNVPSEEIISNLKKRNKLICEKLDNKYKSKMIEAINNNYVDKYYTNFRL